jgi:hypothetical protein
MAREKTLFRLGLILALPILLLSGCIVVNCIAMSSARPPKTLKTIDDFKM